MVSDVHPHHGAHEIWEWEAQNRADAAWPSIEPYLSQRIHTVALQPYLVIGDVAWNYPITDVVERMPDLAMLGSIAAHGHVLLAKGQQLLQHYFPGIDEDLRQRGVAWIDFVGDARRFSPAAG